MAIKNHNSTTTGRTPGVKLTRHKKGWVAKIGGKVRWLAPLDKPQLAMERYHQKMREHLDGLQSVHVTTDNQVSIGKLGELFVDAQLARVRAGDLDPRTYDGYDKGVFLAVQHFGYNAVALGIPTARWQELRAKLARHDVHTLNRHVGAIRKLSRWAYLNEYIDREFRFGTEFNRPSQKAMRAAKKQAGDRTYTAAQVKKIVRSADPILKAMFLLSINGGVGNTDISNLEDAHLKGDRIDFARTKTGVDRVIPLWPETVAAIREARKVRPDPSAPELAGRIFLTETGKPYVRNHFDADGTLTSTTDKISTLFWKGMKDLGIPRSFYDGRRTFQTIGDEVGPAHVVRAIMGHAARGEDMSARYRQQIPHRQLLAIVSHVKKRLGVSAAVRSSAAKSKSAAAPAATAPLSEKSGKPRRPRGGTST